MKKLELEVSVRNLVEYYYRKGDLDMYTYSGSSRMRAGQKAHQKVQNSRPDEYQSEVSVNYSHETDQIKLEIRGRLDLLLKKNEELLIEEIKTITRPVGSIPDSNLEKWWAQAMIYGAILAQKEELDNVELQLTLYHLEEKKEYYRNRRVSIQELNIFLEDLISKYLNWAIRIAEWNEIRDISIKEMDFPFESYRKGQRKLAVRVYQTIKNNGQLLAEAPTGIGKTMAVLFSSIKGIGEGLLDKIFYFTARTTGKDVSEASAKILMNKGLQAKFLILTAKERICLMPEASCHPDECPYAKGFYDRLDAAIEEIFNENLYNRELISKVAEKHMICPFEFSLTISLWCECIICDYNYGFDPKVYLRRFFVEGTDRYLFLIDEAHNLIDRARSMYSAEISKKEILDLKRSVKKELTAITKNLSEINKALLAKRKALEEHEVSKLDKPEELDKPLRKFLKNADTWLERNIQTSYRHNFLDLYFKISFFVSTTERYDKCYRTIWKKNRSELECKLFCLDPSVRLNEMLSNSQSDVFFSATLTPFEYFKESFGCDANAALLSLNSPFPSEHLKISIKRLSTRYRHRKITLDKVGETICNFLDKQEGNTMIFFPSYSYLQQVMEIVASHIKEDRICVQKSGMKENERSEFLKRFSEQRKLAAFSVMGGFFGEGIDLAGDKLEAVIIIGVGLPGIDLERELIREYFDQKEKGFDFAYVFPGITRVLQAAGRLIRTENDKGNLLLIDDRFFSAKYRELFPAWWEISRLQ